MLTTLSILSLDQGRIWREPATAATPQETPEPEPAATPAPERRWLPALRLPARPTALRPARG